MEGKRPKQIPLACRFLPYDQWFLTHVDPTWKIKHIKQIILAKCLSLSFDPRKLARETTGVRPPSPITFAPDESRRPVSPIQFATPQEVRRKKSQMHAAGGRGWLDEGDGSGSGAAGAGVSSSGGAGGRGTGSGEGGFFGDDEDGLGLGLGTVLGMGMGMGIGLSGVGGEEGYEEDDEWDDEDDVPSGGLISPGKRSSIVMGGRVQVPGGTPNWPVVGSPPPPACYCCCVGLVSSSSCNTHESMKIRKKFNPLAKITASSFTVNANTSSTTPPPSPPPYPPTSSFPISPTTPTTPPPPLQHPPPIQSPTPQIYTALYTLIRFSTGQILEEDIPVSWYDLLPNELVELHASIPPLSFGMSKRMGWNLMYPREMMEAYREWDVKVVVERRVGMRGKDKDKDKAGEKEMGGRRRLLRML
ncbi:hypothetical protein CPB84DRAFT_1964160 [Gymnopilus junonius]|uniref:Uncharacterized protein n=1 Tax=Gymnopilus junonius TaxID=109634 RepID=A0A9P5NG10_GYMJU|nr:hypothetical protein CPB84DRAFT_1964160 [Gymnopilus junonius]